MPPALVRGQLLAEQVAQVRVRRANARAVDLDTLEAAAAAAGQRQPMPPDHVEYLVNHMHARELEDPGLYAGFDAHMHLDVEQLRLHHLGFCFLRAVACDDEPCPSSDPSFTSALMARGVQLYQQDDTALYLEAARGSREELLKFDSCVPARRHARQRLADLVALYGLPADTTDVYHFIAYLVKRLTSAVPGFYVLERMPSVLLAVWECSLCPPTVSHEVRQLLQPGNPQADRLSKHLRAYLLYLALQCCVPGTSVLLPPKYAPCAHRAQCDVRRVLECMPGYQSFAPAVSIVPVARGSDAHRLLKAADRYEPLLAGAQ